MSYHITRDGQTYGPYTLEDLQRYVSAGNVLLTDMAKADGAAEWVSVAQLLGGSAAPHPLGATLPSGYAHAPSPYDTLPSAWPAPPNLNWVLVLIIAICTCGLFAVIWDIVQLLWVRKVEPGTKATGYYIGYVVLSLAGGAVSAGVSAAMMSGSRSSASTISGIISIAAFVLMILYRFAMKNSLEQHFNGPDPVGLRLGPVMTFFFGGLYFQYHFNRINEIKQAARYRGY